MIINASAVYMGAQRAYSKTEKKTASTRLYQGTSSSKKKGNASAAATSSISEEGRMLSAQRKQLLRNLEEEAQQRRNNTAATQKSGGIGDIRNEDQATTEMLKRMLEMLKRMREMLREGKLPSMELLDLRSPTTSQTNSNGVFSLVSGGGAAVQRSSVWTQETTVSSFVAESESVNFSTMGMVKTADGREISFNVDLEMSREFMEYAEITEVSQVKRVMTDPLVINLDTNVASVSDQKFRFDLNADGVEDEISYLNSGSGFLALDKNGDGKINDGSELFGAKTGNGFAELAAYDSDGNGWIDEADEIYDKLVVWVKAPDGTDRQLSLKEANVGAIYLGSASTDYSLTNSTADNANAQIRRTGVFLKETGQAGTIQHVDFAID